MEATKYIYKASELIQLIPEIAPHIEHEDWIHIAVNHDPVNKMTCLISFIWDTRDIVRCGLYSDDEEGIDILLNDNGNDHLQIAFANDNHTWLKVRDRENLKFIDYILDVNHEVMNVPVKMKFTRQRIDVNKFGTEYRIDYFLDGYKVCTTTKGHDSYCSISKDGRLSLLRDKPGATYETSWNRVNLIAIFGMMYTDFYSRNFQDCYPDLKCGYKGHLATGKEVKETLTKHFNIAF